MLHINANYQKIPGNYLFAEIARRVAAYQQQNPAADLIKLGIGDVTRPLAPAVAKAFSKAALEMGTPEGFHGYGPDYGYSWLNQAIRAREYETLGISLSEDEVFVSDGAKCDSSNIQELFSEDAVIAVTNPVYPVYVDSNAMAGRAGDFINGNWSRLVYLPTDSENGFVPPLPAQPVDVIYLCYPNNPTGTTLSKEQLKVFVEYARKNGCLIVYDAAYRAFITSDVPHSIYEIEGAREVAIECCSFSKTAGFTGTRCGWMVIPHEVCGLGANGERVSLNSMWKRRMGSKFNGVSYPVQRAAEAVYSAEGWAQCMESVAYYRKNAALIHDTLVQAGFEVYGGKDSPYVWLRTPNGMPSWDFFTLLLENAHVVSTPGVGFGSCGEGYLRLTAFNTYEKTRQALQRILKSV